MNVTITVNVMSGNERISQVAAQIADAIEKALHDVPHATEVTSVTLERETL